MGLTKGRIGDRVYKYLSGSVGSATIIFLAIGLGVMLYASYPSIAVNGSEFFTRTIWNAKVSGRVISINGIRTIAGSSFGILVFVIDTLVSSLIAVLIAIPAGLGAAIFLTQIAPRKVAVPISLMIELLAGIPSVIYGFWGFLVLGPFLLNTLGA